MTDPDPAAQESFLSASAQFLDQYFALGTPPASSRRSAN